MEVYSMATLTTKIQLRRDTAANLAEVVLASGEPAYATDTKKFAIGDGSTKFKSLPNSGFNVDMVDNFHFTTLGYAYQKAATLSFKRSELVNADDFIYVKMTCSNKYTSQQLRFKIVPGYDNVAGSTEVTTYSRQQNAFYLDSVYYNGNKFIGIYQPSANTDIYYLKFAKFTGTYASSPDNGSITVYSKDSALTLTLIQSGHADYKTISKYSYITVPENGIYSTYVWNTITPRSNNAYDLGSSSLKWKNIHGVTLYENGTSLANKYLGINDKAADSDKLDGKDSSEFALKRDIKDSKIIIAAGSGLTAGGDFTLNQASAKTITLNVGAGNGITVTDDAVSAKAGNGITVTSAGINHADTSSATNLTASARTYVTGLTFDAYGHVTGYTTGTEKVTNTNTTYSFSGGTNAFSVTPSGGTAQSVGITSTRIFRQDTRNANPAPYESGYANTGYLSLHFKSNSTIGITGQGNYSALVEIYPWVDRSGGAVHQLVFGNNGAICHRYGTSTWSTWEKLASQTWVENKGYLTAHQSLANYVTLNGNQTITGIKTFSHSTFGSIILKRNGSTNASSVIFQNNNGTLGSIGMTGTVNSGLKRWTADTNTVYTVWDSGNDGSGSGLDADLLDGKHASEFALVGDYLPKTTYEWNKEFAAGSNGAVSLGRYNLYDTQLTFDITTTTALTISGKLVIAAQNGRIQKATIYGDASNTLAGYLTIYQSAITNNRSYVEVFCNFPGYSKNKVHIYGVALNSATVTNQMTSVTFTNGVPSGVTSGDTKWTGTMVNDITANCAATNHTHDVNIATSTGTNELTLAYGTKYALTAGGQSFIFTMPTDSNTTYGADRGISLKDGKFGHSNTAVTAVTTAGLYKIKYDAYGHITGTESFTLPTVNNGTLTIQKNGTKVATFTANQSGNATANITVPTKVSELTNDSKFLTSESDTLQTVTTRGATTDKSITALSYSVNSAVTMEYDSSYKALKFVFA